MTASDTRTIHERLADCMRDVSEAGFVKDGTVRIAGGGYGFISIGQILEEVRKVHGRHGVFTVFGPIEYDHDQHESRRTDGGMVSAVGHCEVVIYGRCGDSIEVTVPCEAKDNSDKLTNKLLTNAERCLYRTLYAIDEGDASDPEAVNIPNPVPAPRQVPKDDPFFSKPDPAPAEEGKPKAEAKPRAKAKQSELTEASVKQAPAKPVKTAAERKEADDARQFVIEYRTAIPDDPVVREYEDRFGSDLAMWPDSRAVDCMDRILEGGQ